MPTELLSAQFSQILDTFVRILNTHPAIGDPLQLTPVTFHPRLRSPSAQRQARVDLISDVLPFGRLWYGEPNAISNASRYAQHFSRSHHAVIRVYDAAGNVIETHEHARRFQRVVTKGQISLTELVIDEQYRG